MRSNEFYKEFNQKIKYLNLEELKDVINNVIRKIPETRYDETLSIFDKEVNSINENDIKNKVKEYKEKFNQIDDFELYFHATGYEDYGEYYSPWSGDWVWEYSDEDNLSDLIYDATMLAVDLTNKRKYKYAKELFDLILYTNYQFLDDDGGDNYEISLDELKENNLININVDILCLYAIYATYQYSSEINRAKNIYEYFKNSNFRKISIEDSFRLGSEVVNDLNIFWNNWINLLLTKSGSVEYRLLKEALVYNNYNDYRKYIDKLVDNHPKIYLDIFNYLEEDNKINEIIEIGNKALSLLDKNLTIRNDIALYLAKYDDKNKEKYIIESFKSNTNIPNLLRIINNEYYDKGKNEINNHINNIIKDEKVPYFITELQKNTITKKEYNYIKFFTGEFECFLDECMRVKNPLGWSESFIQNGVYLWLLYFNNHINSKAYNSILKTIFNEFKFENNTLFLDNDYSQIFQQWKKHFKINNKEKYINWLIKIIDKRVDAIVNNGYRKSYFKVAILVVGLGEVLESNNMQKKEEFVNIYHKKYVRRSSFRKELNKYI